MSLVENIARRPPSNRALLAELRSLKQRNYKTDEIAKKLGLDRTYIYGVVRLVENGEELLIRAVEAGRMPISVESLSGAAVVRVRLSSPARNSVRLRERRRRLGVPRKFPS